MRKLASAILACGAIAWASPSAAHWQNTRWGMTEAEVRSLWPAAAERFESGAYVLMIDQPTTIGGLTYSEIRFTFDTKGRLRVVKLETDEPFATIRDRLAAQVGAPLRDEVTPIMVFGTIKETLFRDVAKGNTITLWTMSSGSTPAKTLLTYKILEAGF